MRIILSETDVAMPYMRVGEPGFAENYVDIDDDNVLASRFKEVTSKLRVAQTEYQHLWAQLWGMSHDEEEA